MSDNSTTREKKITKTTDEVFGIFADQGWSDQSELALLKNWLDTQPDSVRESFRLFLEEAADFDNLE